ncbi:hypothetical protein EMPG_17101 [Blastomyces silverae]|uniref:Uncharacterized protein n=1 Tax=Blastomyces silverae TaxID=2060906 RepID=A0A0H1BDZ9_9EURO|nr:hypothetical protein EMPG_17101 [Blastomyces silverae]
MPSQSMEIHPGRPPHPRPTPASRTRDHKRAHSHPPRRRDGGNAPQIRPRRRLEALVR